MKKILLIMLCGLALSSTVSAQAPLYLQNAILRGKRYLLVKNVTCTNDVLENTTADEGGVSFEIGSDYIFETSGTFRMEKGVTVKRGAKLCIKPSNINF